MVFSCCLFPSPSGVILAPPHKTTVVAHFLQPIYTKPLDTAMVNISPLMTHEVCHENVS